MNKRIIPMIGKLSKTYDLTIEAYLETIGALSILEDSNYSITNAELDILIDEMESKSSCKIEDQFKELHKKLQLDVKKEIVKFLYKVNLIEGLSYSSVKQANFSKDGNLIFYYGILDMKKTDIGVYVNDHKLSTATIGISNDTSDKYVYLSNKIFFNSTHYSYTKYSDLCAKLGVSSCECIKVHYKELDTLLNAIKDI